MKSLSSYKPYDLMYVDAMNLLSRSYHGMMALEYKGQKTGMMFGVARLVLEWRRKCSGLKIIFLWEGRNSWRKKAHAIYKAHRDRGVDQVERKQFFDCVNGVRDALPVMGVDQMWAETYEADDIVEVLAKTGEGKKLFVSTDWDWWPLSAYGDILYQNDVLDKEEMKKRFAKKFGTDPIEMNRLWLFKVLTGDPSDNLSGIPRFPKKLAVALANDPSIEAGSIVPGIAKMGEKTWAKKVQDNDWILRRNLELILPSAVRFVDIEILKGCYDGEAFGDLLLKSGMETLHDRLTGGRDD